MHRICAFQSDQISFKTQQHHSALAHTHTPITQQCYVMRRENARECFIKRFKADASRRVRRDVARRGRSLTSTYTHSVTACVQSCGSLTVCVRVCAARICAAQTFVLNLEGVWLGARR